MDSAIMKSFSREMEKTAKPVGGILASTVPGIKRIFSSAAKSRFGKNVGRNINIYFPTFKRAAQSERLRKIPRTIINETKNVASIAGVGGLGLGGYAIYKGMSDPSELNMSGY